MMPVMPLNSSRYRELIWARTPEGVTDCMAAIIGGAAISARAPPTAVQTTDIQASGIRGPATAKGMETA